MPRGIKAELVGRRIGRLLVVGRAPETASHGRTWVCQCDCGNTVTRTTGKLSGNGAVQSCGCGARGRNHHAFKDFTTILLGCAAVSSWMGTPWTDFVSAAFLLGCAVSNGVAGFQVWRVRQALRAEQTSGEG